MLLKVINPLNSNDISLISLSVLDMGKNPSCIQTQVNIWDTNDNYAKITAESHSDIIQCISDLYDNGKATIKAEINWSN